mmetsp:Transcript_14175/g.13747  ORF Transcript_14175/g.13747 Transcript_14175/m.13747 type:complete len:149 (-) Transcript_14175:28-474(-)
MAWHHILFQLSFIMNLVITPVYFIIIHPLVLQKYADDPWRLMWLRTIHVLPLTSSLINLYLTNIVFIRRHQWYLIYFGVIYFSINFLATKYRGKPLYPFLTWDSYTSLLMVLLLYVVGISIYNLQVEISVRLKKRTAFDSLDKIEKVA